jgi:hypothetical protein
MIATFMSGVGIIKSEPLAPLFSIPGEEKLALEKEGRLREEWEREHFVRVRRGGSDAVDEAGGMEEVMRRDLWKVQ